jgi:NIPSNAP protein
MKVRAMIHQLRIYEILDDTKAAFPGASMSTRPASCGNTGSALWEARTEHRTDFVYLLGWPDIETKTKAWDAFTADEEWREIKRVTGAAHGRMVGVIEDRTLLLTDYSPAVRSAK